MTGRSGLDVVVVGGANVDDLVKGAELPRPGRTSRAQLFQEAPGGKGANQAVAVARLGGRAALVACVGRDARGEKEIAWAPGANALLRRIAASQGLDPGVHPGYRSRP